MLAPEEARGRPVSVTWIVGGEISSNIRAFSENGGSRTFVSGGNDTAPDAVPCGGTDGLVGWRNALGLVPVLVGTVNVVPGEFIGVAG